MHREGQNCSRIPDGSGVHLKQAALLQDVSTLRMCADKGVVHRFALLGALVVAATSLAAPSLGAERRDVARATLEVVSVDPLRVRGKRFRAQERARVTAWIDGRKAIAWTRAGPRGGFIVRLSTRSSSPPSSFRAEAFGLRGSRATIAFDHIICPPTG